MSIRTEVLEGVTWLIDEDGNRASVERFGTERYALLALGSLIRCEGCINCVRCNGCVRCNDCNDCMGCMGCKDCVDCMGCKGCKGCKGCVLCVDCVGLAGGRGVVGYRPPKPEEKEMKTIIRTEYAGEWLAIADIVTDPALKAYIKSHMHRLPLRKGGKTWATHMKETVSIELTKTQAEAIERATR